MRKCWESREEVVGEKKDQESKGKPDRERERERYRWKKKKNIRMKSYSSKKRFFSYIFCLCNENV